MKQIIIYIFIITLPSLISCLEKEGSNCQQVSNIYVPIIKDNYAADSNSDKPSYDFPLDITTLSDEELSINYNSSFSKTTLMSDLIDAYNSFLILNSIWCDFELWIRLKFHIKDAISAINCNIISDEVTKGIMRHYKNRILSILSDNKKAFTENTNHYDYGYKAYIECKEYLTSRFHLNNYCNLSEKEYYRNYDKNNSIPGYKFIQNLRKNEDEYTVIYFLNKINTENNFDRKCIYLIEFAHINRSVAENSIMEHKAIALMYETMKEQEYSNYLWEMWRIWRYLIQDENGASKDSPIFNQQYNEMRRIVACTILRHIRYQPNDKMAINQFLMLSSHNNIYRYGEYPYGNQYIMEGIGLEFINLN